MTMKLSALFYWHQQQDATFTQHQGWELPAYYSLPEQESVAVSKNAGLVDVSYLRKFDLQHEPHQRSWRLGAKHYLVIEDSPSEPLPRAIDVTSVYSCFRLVGPRSRDILSKLTSLNVSDVALANLSCGQASLAHVHTIVMREDIKSIPAFHLLVSREYGESVWESIIDAGDEFHLCPFGLSTLWSLYN
jgi:glycine cleavage system aminomethyltransferase T